MKTNKPKINIATALGLVLLTSLAQAVDSMPFKGPAAPAAVAPGRTQRLTRLDQVPDGLNPSDWASIRAAYEAGRHQVVATEGGWQARNPGQHWGTRFDGRGFLVQPENGHWQWGLELLAYGFPGQEHKVAQPPQVNAQGQRVVYDWDDTLQEWFRNDGRGLEHGFTLRQRPSPGQPRTPGEHSGLIFTLEVRGGLRPEVQADGCGVQFVDPQGAAALTYNSLEVLDASGRKLPARFEPLAGGSEGCHGLRLIIDESDARYPITIDPLAQQAYLKASNTDAGDSFGYSVAISGDTVVVGAPGESSNATGVNGDQSDNSASAAGAAYVFVRSSGVWSQQAYLKASNTEPFDSFGWSVAISGDTVVVGAIGESSNATGVNGDQSDNSASGAGAAYVFVRSSGVWSQQAYLKASNTEPFESFGFKVAISGDSVVVGAPGEASNATGVNGDQSDNSASAAGAAYVFVRSSGVWSQQAYLKASNTDAGDVFGFSVALSDDTVVVGALLESSNATGVNGDQSDNSASAAGAAYVFVRSSGVWSQQAYLKASNTDASDQFGSSVAISGDTVVVGAILEASNATGVNGDQSDNSASAAGAAYVFVRSSGVWSQQAYLKASNTDAGDVFGISVAISGDTVVVGALGEASNATGVNGDQSDNNASFAGAAYVFLRSSGVWSQQEYLKASNTDAGDGFGWSVAISGDTVVVGAPSESSNATGVNGDQSDNSASFAGAAYVFSASAPTATTTATTVDSASVQYSDTLTLQATVSPAAAAGSVQFVVNGNNVGSPVSVSSGAAQLSTQILLAASASTYEIKAQFTSSDPAYLNSQGTGTLTVTREDANVVPDLNNPYAVKVNAPGGSAGPIVLKASITELQNGPGQITGTTDTLGDICQASPLSVTLTPLLGSGTLTVQAAALVSCDGTTRKVQATFNNVPVNVYQVSFSIGGTYYTGTASAVLAVYDPSLGFVTGGGALLHNGVRANFGFSAKYLKSGQIQGSLLYMEHRATGDVVLRSNSMGALAIVANKAVITGKATLSGVGNYGFQATAVDNGDLGITDQFGLKVTNPAGAVVNDLTFGPVTLAGGNIVAPH